MTHRLPDPNPSPQKGRPRALVSGVASDSHTWNLVFLQLVCEEEGLDVVNLGPCVPDELLVTECVDQRPDLVVISTVNGHGYREGLRVVPKLRARPELADVPIVIGGRLGVTGRREDGLAGELTAAGCDRVFDRGPEDIEEFRTLAAAVAWTADDASARASVQFG
ncbi:cobalamin B12-binding domain-containing protein [Nonomuraea jiangxiensis]|uniref:Methylaspartate mutase sigma subunit n=1 Tax=Nonomuraea jiangxiensis TaxID=633440 RepID=A0A1G9H762_9ACTN|nr:cobalamin-dependent protein [Nonomuraea jiangxiensis]SDL08790.1 methylaspartate mutase sigma subunit [Nonomuraea jiangxiensis]